MLSVNDAPLKISLYAFTPVGVPIYMQYSLEMLISIF